MRQVLLLFFYVFLSHASAQEATPNNKSYNELVKLYATYVYTNTAKALTYAVKAKEVASIDGNEEQVTLASYYISKCQNKLSKNTIALQNIDAAITNVSSVKDTLFLYKCLNLKGTILLDLGEDSQALITYIKAKEQAAQYGNLLYEIGLLNNIAFIKKKHKDFEEAITIYKSILKDIKTIGETPDTNYYKILALMNIADAYLWMKQPKEAAIYNKAGLRICSAKDSINYYPLLMNKAIILYQNEHYNNCISVAEEVQNYSEAKNKNLYVTSLFYIGKSHYKLAAYQKTIHYLEQAYDTMNSYVDIDMNEKELHEFLALAYHEVNNPEKNLFHFQKYSELEKKQSLEDIKLNNETHKLVDISPLKTEIDSLGDALTKQNNSKKGFIIMSVSLLLLLIVSILYYRRRETFNKKKIQEVLQKVAELESNQEKKTPSQKHTVSDENVRLILDRIHNFEQQEHYLSTECNLHFMAEKLDTNPTYLSKVMNRYKGKSFSAYITELRINTALLRLKNDKKLQSYTIKAIAEEFGFKRQETFSRAFKSHTGIHPSQYLKNLEEK